MKTEPGEIVAGDSVEWSVTLDEYPAPDWVLHYAMFNKDSNQKFDAVADGSNHKVLLDSVTTAPWSAGRYDWTSYVTKGAERKNVAMGVFIIKADPTLGVNLDGRSHARKMLEAIEATLEGRASRQDLELMKGQFGERAVERDPELLLKWRDYYRKETQAEDDMAAMQAGVTKPRNTKIIFKNA